MQYKCSKCGFVGSDPNRCAVCGSRNPLAIETSAKETSRQTHKRTRIPSTKTKIHTFSSSELPPHFPSPHSSHTSLKKHWAKILFPTVLITLLALYYLAGRESYDHLIGKKFIVTMFKCNVRKKPVTNKDNIIGTLMQKEIRVIRDVTKKKGRLWYRINFAARKGWISEKVCRLIGGKRKRLLGLLRCKTLNMRELPKLGSKKIDQLCVGELLTVHRQLKNGWLQLKTKSGKTGFVNGKYVTVFAL